MASTRPWIVPRHEPLQKGQPDLWWANADLKAGSRVRRRAAIARLTDGRLAFCNAIPLDDASMREIEAWGEPAFVLVPNGFHRLDLAPFKARYPKIKILCGKPMRGRVEKAAPVDGTWDDFPRGLGPEVIPLAGTRGEAVLRAGPTLVFFGDALMNLPHFGGVLGTIFRLLGSTGGPRVTNIAKVFLVNDRDAYRKQLLGFAADAELRRVIPCHGRIIEGDIKAVLEDVARRL